MVQDFLPIPKTLNEAYEPKPYNPSYPTLYSTSPGFCIIGGNILNPAAVGLQALIGFRV